MHSSNYSLVYETINPEVPDPVDVVDPLDPDGQIEPPEPVVVYDLTKPMGMTGGVCGLTRQFDKQVNRAVPSVFWYREAKDKTVSDPCSQHDLFNNNWSPADMRFKLNKCLSSQFAGYWQ